MCPLQLTLNTLQLSDLEGISDIHRAAFPGSALTRLGEGAVCRYYHWLLTGPHDALCLGAYSGGKLVGYCFGGKFKGALTGFLLRNRLYLAWRVAAHPWLLANSLIVERLKLAGHLLRVRKQRKPAMLAPEYSPSFGILAIAVDPGQQGLGIGKMLMEAAEKEARQRNFPQMNLSVAVDNEQAVRFYLSIGWEKVLAQNNVWLGQMIKIV